MRHIPTLCMLVLLLLIASSCGQVPTSAGAHPTAMPARGAPTTVPTQPDTLGMLAYVQQGDVWIRTLPDSPARRLTARGDASAPRWSPSGAWLLYCADDQLRVVRASGADDRPLGPCAGSWAPQADVLVHETETGSMVVVPGVWQAQPLPGQATLWSPTGSALAFVREQALSTHTDSNAAQGAVVLWRIGADGRGAAPIYTPEAPADADLIPAGWYGDQVLFWTNPQFSASLLADGVPLWAVPASGGQPRLLAPEMLANPDFLAPAPDSKTLALVGGGGRETWSNKQIILVDLASGNQTGLTDEHTAALSPSWSPDGRQLAYTAAPDRDSIDDDTLAADIAQRHIWVAQRDGSGRRQLTNDPSYRDERPLWSADGRQLLFARVDAHGDASLWLADADGHAPMQVADTLGPFPDDAPLPLGYYGHVDWDAAFDWWRGPAHPGSTP